MSKSGVLLILLLTSVFATFGQSTKGMLRGRVVDMTGAIIIGAQISVTGGAGTAQTVPTNRSGEFSLNLAPGQYTVRVESPGFAVFENTAVEIAAGRTSTLDVTLNPTIENAEVTVGEAAGINTEPDQNASATVLREDDIEALPDNADELEAALRALAGPGAGPNGGEIFVDGFSGGRLPPRDTIREIRINQNPFSSEHDRLGFGRIEILTKPGTDRFRGEVEFEFEDESFNSRNPFAANRAPFQVREFGANFGGPIIKRRASFFLDFEHSGTDENALINALVLDPNLNAVPLQQAFVTPTTEIEFNPRVDWQISETNTLVARYFFERETADNEGLGGFNLPSRAYRTRSTEQTLQLTDTAVFSGSVINEARFQYVRRRNQEESASDQPTIRVLDAFTGGGANVGRAFANQDRFELQNYVSFARGKHSLKLGGRWRHVHLRNSSSGNFAGTFTFTSLEQYRNTILNLPGAFPSQFSIAGGNPEAEIRQSDLGFFVQDDWRVSRELTLSFGLRYETQTNISSNFNFAPRFAVAYAPGAGGQNRPKTVFRAGFGIFYERFGENLSLQARRFNGLNQQQFVVTSPTILDAVVFTRDAVSNVPTIEQLRAFAQPQTTRIVAPDLQAPYTIQTALSVERQLPRRTTVSVTYVNALTRRLLRSRNINAPLGGARPIPGAGNIFQFESTGRFDQHQLIFNFRSNFREGVSLFANYSLGKARSDTDGAGSFPANSYDLSGEYGDASLDIRHRFVMGSNFEAPLGFRISPFIIFRSGAPFNITTGLDANGDTLFTERPALARDLSEPGIILTRFGAFDPTPKPGDTIIPRNYGRGPEFFLVNLRISKEFGFGQRNGGQAAGGAGNRRYGGRGGSDNPFGGARSGGGGGGGDDNKYELEFSVRIRNLLNRTNKGTPVGNLRSPFFGEPVSLAGGFGFGGGGAQSAGNRRIEFEVQFSF